MLIHCSLVANLFARWQKIHHNIYTVIIHSTTDICVCIFILACCLKALEELQHFLYFLFRTFVFLIVKLKIGIILKITISPITVMYFTIDTQVCLPLPFIILSLIILIYTYASGAIIRWMARANAILVCAILTNHLSIYITLTLNTKIYASSPFCLWAFAFNWSIELKIRNLTFSHSLFPLLMMEINPDPNFTSFLM